MSERIDWASYFWLTILIAAILLVFGAAGFVLYKLFISVN